MPDEPFRDDSLAASGHPTAGGRERLDKWLWYARFFKTRALSRTVIEAGRVRVNGTPVSKTATRVGAGDILTFPQSRRIRVVRVAGSGTRRGPAREAATLFEDMSPQAPTGPGAPVATRPAGAGRPTKKDRRDMDAHHSDGADGGRSR